MKKYYILVLLLSLTECLLPVAAQQHTFSLTGGYTLPFAPPRDYTKCPTFGADCTVSWPALLDEGGRERWLMGFKANVAIIPQGIAGDRICVSAFTTTPFVHLNRWTAAVDLSLQIGAGFGLYTQPKEFTHDDRNQFIGSMLNCVIDVGPVCSIPIGDQALVIGFKFVHNSNAYLVKPNVGLNYVQGELGWRMAPPRQSSATQSRACDTLRFAHVNQARSGAFVIASLGMTVPRNDLAQNGEFYPAYTLLIGGRYAYQQVRSIGLALESAYNFADDYQCHYDGVKPPFPWFLGLTILHETHWGPVSMRLGLGRYIYQSFEDAKIYERVGAYYNFGRNRHQVVGLAIKANMAHADFMEISYGIDLF